MSSQGEPHQHALQPNGAPVRATEPQARWWPRRRAAAPDPAAKGTGPAGSPGPPRTLWEFRRSRPLFSDAVRALP